MSALHDDDRIPERGDTEFRDYILTGYQPVCDPAGRLRQESVYRWALREAGLLDDFWPAVEALRAHLGPDQIVWGAKWGPKGFTSELYFYNNANNPAGHPMQVTTLTEVLKPWLTIDTVMDESVPYFMVSIDFDRASLESDGVGWHIYIGSGDRNRKQCGFSHVVHGIHHTLENHYWFYDPKTELDEVWRRLDCSPRVLTTPKEALVPDYLIDCHTICVAVKPHHDGLYTARVTTPQCARFFGEYGPPELAALLEHHADDLAHLRWDIGYDVRLREDRSTFVERMAIHGVL